MLMGSGPEGTFGSEISATDDGWEEGGRDYNMCVCVCVPVSCLRVQEKGVSCPSLLEMGYGLVRIFLSAFVQLPFLFPNHVDYKPYCKYDLIPHFSAEGYV